MAESWLLRWDINKEEKPAICPGESWSGSVAGLEADPGGFVVFDGYLFDRADFRVGPDAPDAARVAAAYARRGADLFDELRGGFTLAIWDQQRRRLVAGRDAMGLHPCYYWWQGGLFILSPSLDGLLAQPEVRGKFNRVLIAEFLQNIWLSHQRSETFYEDVRRLPPAHRLTLRVGNLAVCRYWDPVPPGFNWATREELSTFPSALERAVGRCLSTGADSLALSGGFDSVSVAMLAAEQRDGKRPLHAVSLRFPDGRGDEGPTQVAVARALGMPQILRVVGESLDGDTIVQGTLAISSISPCPVLSMWQSLYTELLRSAAGHGLRKLLMGTGGDQMLAVDFSYGADLFTAFNLRRLWRFYRAMDRTSSYPSLSVAYEVLWYGAIRPGLIDWVSSALDRTAPQIKTWLRKRHLTPASWISPSDSALTETLEHRRLIPASVGLAPGEGAYVRKIRALPQSPLLMFELEQGGAWAQASGFTLLYPFFDRDLAELLLRAHPEHLIAGGREKTPLRRLVAERLPSVELPTKKVDFTRPGHGVLRTGGRTAWQKLNGPKILAELGIIDPERINRLMENYFAGRDGNWVQTWLVLSIEAWLQARSS